MKKDEKEMLIKAIDEYCSKSMYDREEIENIIINNLCNEKETKKMLIKNKYGLMGSLLYKYRNNLDNEILDYIRFQDKITRIINDKDKIETVDDFLYIYNNKLDDGGVMYKCNDKLKDNLELAKLACTKDFCNFPDVSEHLKGSKELVLFMLENLKPYSSYDGRDYYSNSVSGNNIILLSEVKDNLRRDKDIVRLAVLKDYMNYEGWAESEQREIYYADKSLLSDKDLILDVVCSCPYVLNYITDYSIFEDIEFSMKILGKVPRVYHIFPDELFQNSTFLKNKEYILKSLQIIDKEDNYSNDGIKLCAKLSEDILYDKEIFKYATKFYFSNLHHFEQRSYEYYKDVISYLILLKDRVSNYINKLTDIEYIKELIKTSPGIFLYIKDEEILKQLLKYKNNNLEESEALNSIYDNAFKEEELSIFAKKYLNNNDLINLNDYDVFDDNNLPF